MLPSVVRQTHGVEQLMSTMRQSRVVEELPLTTKLSNDVNQFKMPIVMTVHKKSPAKRSSRENINTEVWQLFWQLFACFGSVDLIYIYIYMISVLTDNDVLIDMYIARVLLMCTLLGLY